MELVYLPEQWTLEQRESSYVSRHSYHALSVVEYKAMDLFLIELKNKWTIGILI